MKVQICTGNSCSGRFSDYIATRLENDKKKFDLEVLTICSAPCMGSCGSGPNIKIEDDKIEKMNPAKASELVLKTYKKQGN